MTLIEELGERIRGIAGTAGSSVVGLGGHRLLGSGVVVRDGVVLTNAHNLVAEKPVVRFQDGGTEHGSVIGIDPDRDLAVIRVGTGRAPSLQWVPETVSVTIGSPVVGLANPGGRGLRATWGMVAAVDRSFRGPRGRKVPNGFEHTALAPPGASGGPVVGLDGGLLGLNTRRLGRGFYIAQTAGPGLEELVESLLAGDRAEPKRLGIGVAPAEVTRRLRRTLGLDEVEGLLVRLVEEGSPAERAGVREGDVLVAADGRATADVDELHLILDEPGEEIELELVRVNDRLTLIVDLS